jgi:FlaA1/EpsC-like NDP-sugar epimerase
MSIPEAVSLVLLSWIISKNGQILLLDMGEPTKIIDLAIHLIKMHGLEAYTDIEIREIGIRPGEKIHEELAYDKRLLRPSAAERVFIAEEL